MGLRQACKGPYQKKGDKDTGLVKMGSETEVMCVQATAAWRRQEGPPRALPTPWPQTLASRL